MRTVRDERGNRYLLLAESAESSRVRDPESGAEFHVANDRLEVVDGESPLVTASRAVPDPVRRVLTAAHDERALGLLLEIDSRSPVDVRTLLGATDCCESDFHGMVSEFQAAGLVEETDVADIRGYAMTDDGREALAVLTEGADPPAGVQPAGSDRDDAADSLDELTDGEAETANDSG